MFPSLLFKFVSKRLKRKKKDKNKTNIFPIVVEASFSLTFDRSCSAMPKAVFRQPAKPILFWYYSSWFWWGITWDLEEKPSSERWKISPHTIAGVGETPFMIIEPARLPWKANRGMGSLMIHIPLRDVNVLSKQKMRSFCVQFISYYANILSSILLDVVQTRNIYCWRNVAGYKVGVEAILTF